MNKEKVWKIVKTILKIALIVGLIAFLFAAFRSCADPDFSIQLPWGRPDVPNPDDPNPDEGGKDDEKVRHVVTLRYSPSKIETKYVLHGVALKEILPEEDPTLTNAIFTGWRINDEPIIEEMKITSSITVVAHWQSTYYEVAFWNGDVRVSVFNVPNGDPIGSRIPSDPQKEGYIFQGWYADGTLVTKDTIVTMPLHVRALFVECSHENYELATTRTDEFGHEQAEYVCSQCHHSTLIYTVHVFVRDKNLVPTHDPLGHVQSYWVCKLCQAPTTLIEHTYTDGVCTICGIEEQPPHDYDSKYEDSGNTGEGDGGENPGGSEGENSGGNEGENPGGNEGDNQGGSEGDNQGDNQGNVETFEPTKDDTYFYFENGFEKEFGFGWETHGGETVPRYKVIAPDTVLVTYIPSEFVLDYRIVIVVDNETFDDVEKKISCNTKSGATSVSFAFSSQVNTFSDLECYFLNGANGSFEYEISYGAIDGGNVQGDLYLDPGFWDGHKCAVVRIFRGIPHVRDDITIEGDESQLLTAFVRGPNNEGMYVGHFVTASGYYVKEVVIGGNIIENTELCNEFNVLLTSRPENVSGMTVRIEEMDTSEYDANIHISSDDGQILVPDVDYAIRYRRNGNSLLITIVFYDLHGREITYNNSNCTVENVHTLPDAGRGDVTFSASVDGSFSISITLK